MIIAQLPAICYSRFLELLVILYHLPLIPSTAARNTAYEWGYRAEDANQNCTALLLGSVLVSWGQPRLGNFFSAESVS